MPDGVLDQASARADPALGGAVALSVRGRASVRPFCLSIPAACRVNGSLSGFPPSSQEDRLFELRQ
jgi:hypothetical protein